MPQSAAKPGPPASLSGLPIAVLTAIGGGLAGLTFFAFVGGAITVARLRGAGLSGTKSVALVPKADLLAVGAQSLLLPTLIAIGAVAFYVEWAAREEGRRKSLLRGLVVVGLLIGVGSVAAAWPPWHWNLDLVLAVLAMAVVSVAGARAVEYVAKPGESRAPAAVLLFLVVALFVATVSYAMGYAKPSVHSVAVVFDDGKSGFSGILVGETADRVWIGEVKTTGFNHGDKSKGRIVELPRSTLGGVSIGSLLPLDEAVREGPRLFQSLKRCLATPPDCQVR